MLQHPEQIGDLLDANANGHFYVCGDAKHMAKDVHRMLHTVLQCHKVPSICPGSHYVSNDNVNCMTFFVFSSPSYRRYCKGASIVTKHFATA